MNLEQVLEDDREVLDFFNAAMATLHRQFCDAMIAGTDFTLSLEVRGDKGRVLHIRNRNEDFRRPAGKK